MFSYIKQKVIICVTRLPLNSISLGTPYRHSGTMAYLLKYLNVPFYLLKGKEEIKLSPPILNVPSPPIYADVANRIASPQYIIQLVKGRVWGLNGAVITNEDVFLYDLSREFGIKKHYSEHSIYHTVFLKRSTYIHKKIAVVATAGGNVYYHWMLDILPRILLLKEAEMFEEIEAFIINYSNHPFQQQTLDHLGISSDKIINCDNNKYFHVCAEKLYVPSLISGINKVNKYEIELLRKYFLNTQATAITNFKRIYISRKKINTRTIINEVEIENFLLKYDFVSVEMENYTVFQQIQLFHHAEIIIGPHGSAFTNLVFSEPGTIFIEMLPDTNVVPCFYNIAAQMGIKYFGFVGDGVPINNSCKNDNININLASFKKFVEPIFASFSVLNNNN